MRRAYGAQRAERGHPVPVRVVVAAAMSVSLAAWTASTRVGVLAGLAAWVVAGGGRSRTLGLLVVLGGAAGWRAADSWAGLAPDRLGSFTGWVTVVDDPQPYPGSTRVILEIDGERFELWARGRALRQRVGGWEAGTQVRVHGTRVALDPARQARVAWQHVVGEFEYEWASDEAAGAPVARAANRVRHLLDTAARRLPDTDAALYRGLVIGDDRDQPPEMLDRFRASGLSHLTAVSGQNVAYVLLGAAPLLRRLRTWGRWAATLALIGWFVVLTRAEPSIVRAGAMAAVTATGFALGRQRSPARILAVAVVALLLADPLLVRSVGFQLSVAATAGVVVLSPRIARRLGVLGPLAEPVGVTLGAQAGVALPQVLVFGSLPLVSLPANLLAVPVAGAVMLYGLPAGLLGGAVPELATPLMVPVRAGVRWVDLVAAIGAAAEPGPPVSWVGWAVVVAVVAVCGVVSTVCESSRGVPDPHEHPAASSTRPGGATAASPPDAR